MVIYNISSVIFIQHHTGYDKTLIIRHKTIWSEIIIISSIIIINDSIYPAISKASRTGNRRSVVSRDHTSRDANMLMRFWLLDGTDKKHLPKYS